jgi:hypothetical protein
MSVAGPLIAPLLADDPGATSGRTEYRCAGCGYGVIVSDPPRACPMCKTHRWDPVVREPLAHPDGLGTDARIDELAARRLRARQSRSSPRHPRAETSGA